MVENDRRANAPFPTPIISQNTFDQNFDITILFNVVKKFGNYVFEEDPPAAIRVKVLSYALGGVRFL